MSKFDEGGAEEFMGDSLPENSLKSAEEITPESIEDNYNKAIAEEEKDPNATPEGTAVFQEILGAAKDYLTKIVKDHPGALMLAGGMIALMGYNTVGDVIMEGIATGLEFNVNDALMVLTGFSGIELGKLIFKEGSDSWKEKHGKPLFSLSLLGNDYKI